MTLARLTSVHHFVSEKTVELEQLLVEAGDNVTFDKAKAMQLVREGANPWSLRNPLLWLLYFLIENPSYSADVKELLVIVKSITAVEELNSRFKLVLKYAYEEQTLPKHKSIAYGSRVKAILLRDCQRMAMALVELGADPWLTTETGKTFLDLLTERCTQNYSQNWLDEWKKKCIFHLKTTSKIITIPQLKELANLLSRSEKEELFAFFIQRNRSGEKDEYIRILSEKLCETSLEDFAKSSGNAPHVVETFVRIGINPHVFSRHALLDDVLKLSEQNQQRYLLAMRDRTTPLGRVCARRFDFSQACSHVEKSKEDKDFFVRLDENISRGMSMSQRNITEIVHRSLMVHYRFVWRDVLILLKADNGARASLELMDISFKLIGVLYACVENKTSLPSLDEFEELLAFGWDHSGCDLGLNTLVQAGYYRYAALIIKYGFDPTHKFGLNNGKMVTLLDKIGQANDETNLDCISDLLNFGVPITDEQSVIPVILKWLRRAKVEEATPNICAYLKSYKAQLLAAIKCLPESEAYPLLGVIVKDDKEVKTSAIGKVFWTGHTSLNKGNLGEVNTEYFRLKEKSATTRALPYTLSWRCGAQPFVVGSFFPRPANILEDVLIGLASATTLHASQISIITDLIACKKEINADFITLLAWAEQVAVADVTPAMLEHLKQYKDQLFREMETLPAAEELQKLEKIFGEENTVLKQIFFAGHPDMNGGRLGKVFKRYDALKNPRPEVGLFDAPRPRGAADAFVAFFGVKRDDPNVSREDNAQEFLDKGL